VTRPSTRAPAVTGTARECAVLSALAEVGDFWTLAILRCISLGTKRFGGITAELGISTNILTDRLRRLVEAGVLEQRRYQDRPVRHEYVLTPRGEELAPVLIALKVWGEGCAGLGER
jgi:DNA-binding HxlR family transcriptional regulator